MTKMEEHERAKRKVIQVLLWAIGDINENKPFNAKMWIENANNEIKELIE